MSYLKYQKFLKENGIQRTDYDNREIALIKVDALKSLDLLSDTNICVLGGDVYMLEDDGYLRPTYDNWYFEKSTKVGKEYAKISRDKAYDYISSYKEKQNLKIRYVLVLDENSFGKKRKKGSSNNQEKAGKGVG